MSRERSFTVKICVEEENDGAAFLSKGAERTHETCSIDNALARYSADGIRRAVEDALRRVREHDERTPNMLDEPVDGATVGHAGKRTPPIPKDVPRSVQRRVAVQCGHCGKTETGCYAFVNGDCTCDCC